MDEFIEEKAWGERPQHGQKIEVWSVSQGSWETCVYLQDGVDGLLDWGDGELSELEEYDHLFTMWRDFPIWREPKEGLTLVEQAQRLSELPDGIASIQPIALNEADRQAGKLVVALMGILPEDATWEDAEKALLAALWWMQAWASNYKVATLKERGK